MPPIHTDNDSFDKYFSSGSGTIIDPYVVDEEGIANLAELVNSGETSFLGTVFQATDMDLTGIEFTPIGTEENPFNGIFQGPSESDKAVIKLSIERNDLDYAGLFGVLGESAEVRNLSVSGNISNGKINEEAANPLNLDPTPASGLIAGLMTGNSIIQNCTTEEGSSVQGQRAGGLVGKVEGGSIIGCINYASVSDIDGQDEGGPGGITGAAAHDPLSSEYPAILISECVNYGTITTYNKYNVGGIATTLRSMSGNIEDAVISESENHGPIKGEFIVGGIVGSVQNAKVTSSHNYGTLATENETSEIGGIAGYLNGGTIESSGNHEDITVPNSTYVGGIAGLVQNNSIIKDSINSNSIEGLGWVGGIAGLASNSEITGTEKGGIENTGNVAGKNDTSNHYGGIAGVSENSKINNAVNKGNVTGRANVGGIAGTASEGTSITYTDNIGSISSTARYGTAGGIVGTASTLTIENASNTGSVEAVLYAGGLIGANAKDTLTTIKDTESKGIVKGHYATGLITNFSGSANLENVKSEATTESKISYRCIYGESGTQITMKNCSINIDDVETVITSGNLESLNIAPPAITEIITIS